MSKRRRTMWTIAGAVIVLLLVYLAIRAWAAWAPPPSDLGVDAGRLAACPASPNCVSSQAGDTAHRVDPIAPPEGESLDAAWQRLVEHIRSRGDATVQTQRGGYLHATFRSRLFGFIDDFELYRDDEAGVVHVRSASRSGHSDMGVNRRRVESLRQVVQKKNE